MSELGNEPLTIHPFCHYPKRERDTYRPETWGHGATRGIAYAQTGAPVAAGTKGVLRKISQGRKSYRGMASGGVK